VYERGLEEVSCRLRHLRRRAREAGVLAAACAVAALVALAFSVTLAGSFALAAGVAAATAGFAVLRRHVLLGNLATERSAYALPEVESFARKAVAPRERERTARAFRRMLGEGGEYPALWLPERVLAVEGELRALADALSAPTQRVAPIGAVACRQLVTNPVQSPLYNPELPVEELAARLHTIRQTLID
jgi:hypothetical protein